VKQSLTLIRNVKRVWEGFAADINGMMLRAHMTTDQAWGLEPLTEDTALRVVQYLDEVGVVSLSTREAIVELANNFFASAPWGTLTPQPEIVETYLEGAFERFTEVSKTYYGNLAKLAATGENTDENRVRSSQELTAFLMDDLKTYTRSWRFASQLDG
jgi:hypothetical protein